MGGALRTGVQKVLTGRLLQHHLKVGPALMTSSKAVAAVCNVVVHTAATLEETHTWCAYILVSTHDFVQNTHCASFVVHYNPQLATLVY